VKQFDFYEFTGILAPGSLFLAGVVYLWPDALRLDTFKDISVGGLGVFVLLAYACGHLIQAVGNVVEWAWWKLFGGLPSDWVRSAPDTMLAPAQIEKLTLHLRQTLGLDLPADLKSLSQAAWFSITRQIYAAVNAAGRAQRIDTFNGNYGLHRGLMAAALVLAVLALFKEPVAVPLSVGFLVVAGVAAVRMHRFAKHYARELFVQFLQLSNAEASTDKK
jgi:hypothetical protein